MSEIKLKVGNSKILVTEESIIIKADKMSEKYEPIRASELYIKPKEGGEVRATTSPESQIDRVEKKLDRVLELLESKDSSVLEIGKLSDLPDDAIKLLNVDKDVKN